MENQKIERMTPAVIKQRLMSENIQTLVPKGEKGIDEVLASLRLAIADSQDLSACLNSQPGKISLYNAVRKAVRTGLSLNPQEGKAALVPFKGKISYMIMKNGLVELALKTGKISSIDADIVRENDTFEIEKSSDGDKYKFSPALKDRGELIGYFATVRTNQGECKISYMSAEEVAEHRKRFSSISKMPEIGYGKKTVLKRCLNDLALSAVDQAMALDGDRPEPEYDLDGEFATIEETKKGPSSAKQITETIKARETIQETVHEQGEKAEIEEMEIF